MSQARLQVKWDHIAVPDSALIAAPARSAGGVLPVLQMAVPMVAAAGFFIFRGEATDLTDPALPIAFRVGKDAAFALLVFVPLILAVLFRGPALRLPLVIYWFAPIALAALMLFIGTIKFHPGFVPVGQVRNMAFYYFGAGALTLLAVQHGYAMRLFTLFRLFMAASVLLGLAFYAFADDLLLYTIHGRMIGTHGNPNFLGYLCFLWIVVIHGRAYAVARRDRLAPWEVVLAVTGLVAAGSIAAVLSYVLWLCAVTVLVALRALPPSSALRRLLAWQLIGGIAITVVMARALGAVDPEVFELAIRIQNMIAGGSESTWVRTSALGELFDAFGSVGNVFIGQSSTSAYVQFDGSAPSILYNLGVPFFLLWCAFFLTPVFFVARRWRTLKRLSTPADGLALMLAPFLVVSVFVEFWIQYVPEMYPTCFIIGWILYFLMWHTTHRYTPSGNAAHETALA
jgi:hypothetical protein